MPNTRIKSLTKTLAKELTKMGVTLPHHKTRELAAKIAGEPNLHALEKKLRSPKEEKPTAETFQELGEELTKAWILEAKKENPNTQRTPGKIKLQQVLVTILSHEEEGDDIPTADLSEIAYQLDEGDYIGEHKLLSTQILSPEDGYKALLKVGNDGGFFGTPLNPEELIYLTNACGDECFHIEAEELNSLGLETAEDGYPLTEKEQEQMDEILTICGHSFLGSYSALQNNQKWHCPTCEIPYKDKFWGETGSTFPTRKEAQKRAQALKETLEEHQKQGAEGEILITDDMPGRICVILKKRFD